MAEEMAQSRWAPEEVVARPPETLMVEKPRAKVQSWKRRSRSCPQWRLNRGKSECFSHVMQDTIAQASATTESQWLIFSHTPHAVLTFKA